jgi:hypothetical protein
MSAIYMVCELPRLARGLSLLNSSIATSTVARISDAVTSHVLPYAVLWRECGLADHETYSVLPLLLMQHSPPRRYTFGFWFGMDVSTTATCQCLQRVTTVFGWCYHPPGLSLISLLGSILTGRYSSSTSQLYIHQIYGSLGVGTIVSTALRHIICMVPDLSSPIRVIQVKLLPNNILSALYLFILRALINKSLLIIHSALLSWIVETYLNLWDLLIRQ